MSNLTILRTYVLKSNLADLPPSILFTHTDASLTIFDAYPKAIFHFLILPRVVESQTVKGLSSLRSLLKSDKTRALNVLKTLGEDAQSMTKTIEEEMVKRYGFKWDIWTGFHAVPSMEHLHLHVISSDLVSPALKVKKHYNSFHPKLGFFLLLDEVLSWFDADPSYFNMKSELKKNKYEPLLKEDLICWRCEKAMKNMPTLKAHLQEEWDTQVKLERARLEKKRKRDGLASDEEARKVSSDSGEPSSKRVA